MSDPMPADPSSPDIAVPDTPAVSAARAYGVDIDALVAQLACTPAERLRRLDAIVSLRRRVRPLPGVSAESVVAARRATRM